MKRTDILLVLLLFAGGKSAAWEGRVAMQKGRSVAREAAGVAQEEISAVLSLDSCRALAVRNNKELRMAGERLRAATYEHKAARTKYMPRVSATGVYMHTSREISLLSDEQKDAIGNVGTSVSQMVPLPDGAGGALNGLGGGLVDALRTDTRNMGAAAVMLTQPVYMGGRIAAYNSITRDLERIAGHKLELARQEVAVSVDETYWQIVSLLGLAEGYLRLVEKFDGDVQQMIAAGVATKADGLSVRVKVNEARVALIQVNNGLALSQMALCRLCGLPMDMRVMPEDGLCGGGEVVPDGSEVSAGGISGGARLADGFKAEAEALDCGVYGRDVAGQRRRAHGILAASRAGCAEPFSRHPPQQGAAGACRISAYGGTYGRLDRVESVGFQQFRAQFQGHVECRRDG